LLKVSAKANRTVESETNSETLQDKLYSAIFDGKKSLIKSLLGQGANVDNGALQIAAFFAPLSTVRLLLADYNLEEIDLGDLLCLAASRDVPKKVEFLLDMGADINAKDKDGLTPLMHGINATSSFECLSRLKKCLSRMEDVHPKSLNGHLAILDSTHSSRCGSRCPG
jgi:ankyrin repeat protein